MLKIYKLISLISKYFLYFSNNKRKKLIGLIGIFIISGLLFKLLDYTFIGLTYIIVYVGAISILFIFVIKMSSVSINNTKISFLSYLILISLILIISTKNSKKDIKTYYKNNKNGIYINKTDINTLGVILYKDYSIIIILIGIILLLVLIGILKIAKF